MITMKPSRATGKLTPNHDAAFQMEQLLTQTLDPSYPPIKHIYDFIIVYRQIDKGEDVDEYVDYEVLKQMKQTLDQFPKGYELKGNPLIYKNILEKWA